MNRRELGIAALGAAAGIAGCSQPARSLFVPEATAAAAVRPDATSIHWLRLNAMRVDSNFDIFLLPNAKNYWQATNSHPHVATVSETHLAHGYLYVHVVGAGDTTINLTGKGGETLVVLLNAH
jgi:hypothetical protein